MDNESYQLDTNKTGLVGLSRYGKKGAEKSQSGFWISLAPIYGLKEHVVVGEVVEGLEELREI